MSSFLITTHSTRWITGARWISCISTTTNWTSVIGHEMSVLLKLTYHMLISRFTQNRRVMYNKDKHGMSVILEQTYHVDMVRRFILNWHPMLKDVMLCRFLQNRHPTSTWYVCSSITDMPCLPLLYMIRRLCKPT